MIRAGHVLLSLCIGCSLLAQDAVMWLHHSPQPANGLLPSIANAVCVLQAGNIGSDGRGKALHVIPKVLVCSQLPADTTHPLDVTLILSDSLGEPLTTGWCTRHCKQSTSGTMLMLHTGVVSWQTLACHGVIDPWTWRSAGSMPEKGHVYVSHAMACACLSCLQVRRQFWHTCGQVSQVG